MPKLPEWFIPALVLMFMIQVGISYVTQSTPVFSLIGLIVTTTSVLVYRMVRKPSAPTE